MLERCICVALFFSQEPFTLSSRYQIAASIGIFIGFFSLLAVAFSNAFSPLGDSWNIPQWDRWQQDFRPEMELLQAEALWFRACMLFMKHGFEFFLVPTFFACAVAKLNEMADEDRTVRCLSKSLLISAFVVGIVSLVFAIVPGPFRSTGLPIFQFQLREGIGTCVFLVYCAVSSGIAPALWFFLFVLLLLTKNEI